jgi:hypothetical protein
VKRKRDTEKTHSFVIIDNRQQQTGSSFLNFNHSMAATADSDWVSCCRDNQGDKGTIEALCSLDDGELAEISKTHNNNNAGALRTTIASSGGGNFLLAPGFTFRECGAPTKRKT